MKRNITILLVLALVAGALSLPASAGKRKRKKPKRFERVLEVRYDTPAVGSPGVGGVTTVAGAATAPNETWLTVEQTDDFSPLPFVRLAWDTDGDGSSDTGFTVCGGQTEEPVEIPGGVTLNIFPYTFPGPQCATGFNTTGTIKFTFSNMP